MDTWSIIAICIVVPAIAFLIAAAVVSSLRMSRQELSSLLLIGLVSLPLAIVCRWLAVQEWLVSPLDMLINLVGFCAGFIVAYAAIAWVTRMLRGGLSRTWRYN